MCWQDRQARLEVRQNKKNLFLATKLEQGCMLEHRKKKKVAMGGEKKKATMALEICL